MNGADMDLRDLTDEDLDAHRLEVVNEQERRANLAAIPDQIAAMAKLYRDGGGDEAALQDALTSEERTALTEVPTEPEPSAAAHFDYLGD